MTLADFEAYGKRLGLRRPTIDRVFRLVRQCVLESGRLSIPGFGVFVRHDRPARRVKVPGHRDADLPPTWSIGFRAGKNARGKR